jgi:hypothetical protein
MSENKNKPHLTGCFGIGIIVFFAIVAWVSSCNHQKEEAKLPVIAVTFDTIKDLDSKVVDNLDQQISITGYLFSIKGERCNDLPGERCYLVLVAEAPKSTDIPIHLSVLKALGKSKANAVFITSTGELNLYTNDKQLLTSDDLILVTGHLIGNVTDSGADIDVDTLEAAP